MTEDAARGVAVGVGAGAFEAMLLGAASVIGVAAAEAAVGLAIFIALHRLKESIDVDRGNILRW